MAGVKGMRWGVRRSSSALRAAAASRGDKKASTDKPKTDVKAAPSGGGQKPAGNIQDNVESSSARYARLTAQVKGGGARELTEQDLKFVNARTDALAKVQKMAEEQPSWLKDTATKVLQQSAQRQMQGLADTLADKYIGDPLKNALKGAAAVAPAAKAAAAVSSTPSTESKVTVSAIKKAAAKVVTPEATPAPKAAPMRFNDALQYYKDNPSVTPSNLEGYSPSAQKILLDEIKAFRKRTS